MAVHGKTVIITGASRGIGEAAAHVFADAGANVVLLARSEGEIGRIAGEIGDRARAIPCDVANWEDMERAVDAAEDTFGPVEVLINNAGVVEPIAHLATSEPSGWGTAIDVNLKGVYHGMRAVMPGMIGSASPSLPSRVVSEVRTRTW